MNKINVLKPKYRTQEVLDEIKYVLIKVGLVWDSKLLSLKKLGKNIQS